MTLTSPQRPRVGLVAVCLVDAMWPIIGFAMPTARTIEHAKNLWLLRCSASLLTGGAGNRLRHQWHLRYRGQKYVRPAWAKQTHLAVAWS